MQNVNMEKDTTGESTENPTILESVPTEQFALRTFTNEQGKPEYQVVKLDATGGAGLVMSNVPVTLPENVSVHVDQAGRLTLQVSGAIDGLTGDLGGSGDAVTIPGSLIGDVPASFNKKVPPMLLPSPDAPPSIRTVDGVLQMGRVSSIMGNVTDCLRMMPEADPLDCMDAAVQSTATPATSTPASASFPDVIPAMQDSIPNQSDPCPMNVAPDIRDAVGDVGVPVEAAGTPADSIVTSEALIDSSVGTMTSDSLTEVMANMARTTESHAACSLPGPVPIDTISLPSLVSIGVPNVELTRTGQLVIMSRGSLVYADQTNSLLTMATSAPEANSPLKESTVEPNVQDENQPTVEPKVKRKGGWPKGKKRKKDLMKEPNVPKAPTTAYSLYLNEQLDQMKKKHPKKPFYEIIKILGRAWSKMSTDRKKKYLTDAAMDKKRYIDELRVFQHSEMYQTLLRRQVAKKIKDMTGDDGTIIDPDVSASVLNDLQLEEDDPNDLLCKICDQYFSTPHNKKEHMYGKQHLLTLTGKLCEIEKEVLEIDSSNHQLTNPAMMDPTNPPGMATGPALPSAIAGQTAGAGGTDGMPGTCTCQQHPLMPDKIDIEQFTEGFMELNLDREIELRDLRCQDQELFELNMQLSSQCEHLQEALAKATLELEDLKRVGTTLSAKLEALRMVPTLFGVINF